MEFGWINLFGVITVILLLIPNIVYAVSGRKGEDSGKNVPKPLSVCEQVGRYASMVLMWLPLPGMKFGFGSAEEMVAYLFLNGALILCYFVLWIVYAKKPSLKSAMALAIIPAAIFLISGVLLRHPFLAAAAVLFGVSHGAITYITHAPRD